MTFVRLLCSSVAVLVAIGSSLPSAWASETNDESRLRRVGASYRFDVNLEGGLGAPLDRPERLLGFGRARIGLLAAIEPPMPQSSPLFVTVGATVGASNAGSPSIGLQGEVMHLASGFWAQGGGFFDLQTPSPGLMAGAGWSLFGAEIQRRFVDEDKMPQQTRTAWVLFGKLRAPVTLLLGAF